MKTNLFVEVVEGLTSLALITGRKESRGKGAKKKAKNKNGNVKT